MKKNGKKEYLYTSLIIVIAFFSVSIFYFFNKIKQEDIVKEESKTINIINYSQLDGYYLGFMKNANSDDPKQLVFFRLDKVRPKDAQTPQADITYQAIDPSASENISYDFLTSELNKKAPEKLLDSLAVFGQGPLYWCKTTETSEASKEAAASLYTSKKNDKLSLIISYSGSDEPNLSSFSLAKVNKNKMNDKGIASIKQYLLNPEKNEQSLLSYYGIFELDKAIEMVNQGMFRYIGVRATPIFD